MQKLADTRKRASARKQKGAVKHANQLVRQYIDKQMNISNITYNKLLVIQNKLNYRPRKVIAFNKPATFFYNFAC